MKIVLIRHGEPLRDGLSDEGARQAAVAGKAVLVLSHARRESTRMFSSPSPRAKATAEIIAKNANLRPAEIEGWLGEDANYFEFFKGLLEIGRLTRFPAHLVLVGHQFNFEELLRAFLGGNPEARPGEVYEIDLDSGSARKLDT